MVWHGDWAEAGAKGRSGIEDSEDGSTVREGDSFLSFLMVVFQV